MARVTGAHEMGLRFLSVSDILHPAARLCTDRAPTAQGATGYKFWCRSSLTKNCSGDGIVPATWLIGPLLVAKWIGYHYHPQACWQVFAFHTVDVCTVCILKTINSCVSLSACCSSHLREVNETVSNIWPTHHWCTHFVLISVLWNHHLTNKGSSLFWLFALRFSTPVSLLQTIT